MSHREDELAHRFDTEWGQIRSLLAEQDAAWNGGDLEVFLDLYDKSPSVTYITTNGERIEGWDEIRSHYFHLMKATQGAKVATTELRFVQLSPISAVVTGRWKVGYESEVLHGFFTLVLEKGERGWKIIHDHSS